MNVEEVQRFFEGYRDAFNRLDGDAVADLWASPSGIADAAKGEARLTWWPDEAPMRANHRALCDVYAKANYGQAQFDMEHCLPLGEQHAFAVLKWRLTQRDGSPLQQFHTAYQLQRTPGGADSNIKVLLCTAYEEKLSEMTPHAAQ